MRVRSKYFGLHTMGWKRTASRKPLVVLGCVITGNEVKY